MSVNQKQTKAFRDRVWMKCDENKKKTLSKLFNKGVAKVSKREQFASVISY